MLRSSSRDRSPVAGIAAGVVVDHDDPGLPVAVDDGAVEFDQRLVLPQRAVGAVSRLKPGGDVREHVVAVLVGEVAGPDLGADVPAAERARG